MNTVRMEPKASPQGGDTVLEGQAATPPPPPPAPQAEFDAAPPEVRPFLSDSDRRLNQYVMVDRVGAGGMGSVWKAWDTKLTRWVAVKFLSVADETSVRRFHREAQMAGRLRHPNIASVHEVNEVKGLNYLVMEYIDGTSIGKANLPFRQMLETFAKVCHAVEYAHRNSVIHRDIKPANIMLSKEGEPFVTDFGLAKVTQAESSLSVAGEILGTPAYMSPEQATGKIQSVDAKSDIYSLGATLYVLATGRAPFEGENSAVLLYKVTSEEPTPPRKVNPQVPAPIEHIILKALEKDKRSRYATAGEMADDLHRFLQEQPVVARAPGVLDRLVRRIRRNPWPTVAASAIVLAGGLVALILATRSKDRAPIPSPPAEVAASPEKEWRERFDSVRDRFEYPRLPSGEVAQETKGLLAEMPESQSEGVSAWFQDQADRIPAELWPKREWLEKKAEAQRILDWSSAVGAILEDRFPPIRAKLAAASSRFSAVPGYRGKITLRIAVWPYAEVAALQAGSDWIVRDGRKVECDARILGDDLCTPLVVEELDIADYAIVLRHPELGERSLTIPGQRLENGRTYYVSGLLDKKDSVALRGAR